MVSNNDAYNALYEFMGQGPANSQLKKKGYNIRVTSRLERPVSIEQNRHTEAIRFVKNDTLVYRQPGLFKPGFDHTRSHGIEGKWIHK